MSGADSLRNKAEELKGKIKETAGQAVGNERLEAEGRVDRATGDIKQAGEKLKDAAKSAFGE
ncbi:CsbD family protein [Dactylosporangium sp. NPDC051484]|uniref:CsbD family protein n=1 Tax=Dactylosporangium sp. NPDC051484 TaxID=3154942 RepID=UPI00344C286E